MDKAQFLDELANILDADEIKDSDVLDDMESWDSLSVLSVIALADSKFGFTLTLDAVKTIKTVADLWNLFEKNRTK